MSQENIKIVYLGGYTAYQHKMEIVFKCIKAEIAKLDEEQESWRKSKAWDPIFPPEGYERNETAIRALMKLSRRITGTLKLNHMPYVSVEIGE